MNQRARTKKKQAYFWGLGAEWMAIVLLVLKGYSILARRFKCKSGEIDLIARKGNVICFIEVKARKNKRDALSALSPQQIRRITRAASWYMAQNMQREKRDSQEVYYRFDMIAVEPWGVPTHVIDAWQTELS